MAQLQCSVSLRLHEAPLSDPTMPAPTQQALIYILLLWTTILSITQVVCMVFFFTAAGRNGTFRKPITEVSHVPHEPFKSNNSSPNEAEHQGGEGKMLTYTAVGGTGAIKWTAKHPDTDLISESGSALTIMKDGYYFLSLQVTLYSFQETTRPQIVTLERKSNSNMKVLLQGTINPHTYTTGLLGKVEELFAGGSLEVTISPASRNINNKEWLTHLDIIYLAKPDL
ncbi:uncharacterized protein LOC129171797 isoform X2 [Dunckerocampus dactyliophorus]|uniref:uncharacterized protein LOC129171797 isoform X2 n=1 Tax=Dunckerocampus dactyliophorus TaxID=161453 RepID=UPI0024070B84|nr:uncharacterized protein LOC129171797 isoform X2 [Dunckerocampus dactyliophorus]